MKVGVVLVRLVHLAEEPQVLPGLELLLLEAKALRKLRHPSRSRKLKAFLEGSRI